MTEMLKVIIHYCFFFIPLQCAEICLTSYMFTSHWLGPELNIIKNIFLNIYFAQAFTVLSKCITTKRLRFVLGLEFGLAEHKM